MKRSAPIQVIVYHPVTEEGRQELRQRVAGVHADYVFAAIEKLSCPMQQKLELLQAVGETARESCVPQKKKDRAFQKEQQAKNRLL